MEKLSHLFKHLGQHLICRSNQPLDMCRQNTVWLITKGRLEVFYAQKEDNGQRGRHHFLMSITEGQVALGLPPSPSIHLVGKGHPNTEAIQLDWDTFFSQIRPKTAGKMVDQWCTALCGELLTQKQPSDHRVLRNGDALELEAGTAILPAHGPIWTRATTKAQFLGLPELPPIAPGKFFPLATQTWMTFGGKASVQAIAGEELLANAADRDAALHNFHRMVLALIELDLKNQEREWYSQGKWRAQVEAAELQLAGENLIAAVLRERQPLPVAPVHELQAVINIVAGAMGCPPLNNGAPCKGRDPVRTMARAIRLRPRKVNLSGPWWQRDNGPFLGFLAENGQPVALIPAKWGGYLLKGATGANLHLPKNPAGLLEENAWQFFRPLPEQPLSLKDMFLFSWPHLRRDWHTLLLAGTGVGLMAMAMPIAVGFVFDYAIPLADYGQIATAFAFLLLAALAATLFRLTRGLAMMRLKGKLDTQLQTAIWDRLLRLPPSFFRLFTAGETNQRAMGIHSASRLISQSILVTLLPAIFSLFNLGIMFVLSPNLALVGCLVILIGFFPFLITPYQLALEKKLTELEGKLSGLVFELLTGISKLRVAGAESRGFRLWSEQFGKKKSCALAAGKWSNAWDTWNTCFPLLAWIIIFVALSREQNPAETISTGTFLAFSSAFNQLLAGFLGFSQTWAHSLQIFPVLARLKPILQTQPEVTSIKLDPGNLRGEIDIRHLHFRYSNSGPTILQNLSLNIQPGSFVAIVGKSGSGKSTLLRLMLGFETPQSGSVHFDGMDAAGADMEAIRSQIGVVLQNSRLQRASIFENIVGERPFTLEEAWRAASLVGLAEDIESMPMQMHTLVNEGGSMLSGGQRQRILLARALIAKPSMLFLDEATSALDNRTQAHVARSLEELHVTRIIIAHRLSTVRYADQIIVMEQGQITESGTYEDLMAKRGAFAELASRQLID